MAPAEGQATLADEHSAIEFRHLRYFLVVAEELHIGRAAARLYMTQPGLSQAIARLERELGVPVFVRTQKGVELTMAGAELMDDARRLLADLDATVARARTVGLGEPELIRVGVALLAEPLVKPALRAFQGDHERIALDQSAALSDRLLTHLRDCRLQAAIVHQVPTLAGQPGLAWEPLRRGRLAVLVSGESRLARRGMVPLNELSGETFLINPVSMAPGSRDGLRMMCYEFGGFEPNVMESIAATTVAFYGDWRLIQDGTAIMLIPEAAARAVCPAGVTVIPVEPPPRYAIALAWRRDERAIGVLRFINYLRSYRDNHTWITNIRAL